MLKLSKTVETQFLIQNPNSNSEFHSEFLNSKQSLSTPTRCDLKFAIIEFFSCIIYCCQYGNHFKVEKIIALNNETQISAFFAFIFLAFFGLFFWLI
jgi:hypothetical protein